jgi:hypothetical protein
MFTKRKRGIVLDVCIQKSFACSKGFAVQGTRTCHQNKLEVIFGRSRFGDSQLAIRDI